NEERYITYLPHSGLHNQRIALINAMLLSKALNRTLLMPEINIGKAIVWRPFSSLSQQMDKCILDNTHAECENQYKNYKPMLIEDIFDISAAKKLGIKTEQRMDMRKNYVQRHHKNRNPFYHNHYFFNHHHQSQLVYKIHDSDRYAYRIHDNNATTTQDNTDNQKYTAHIQLESLFERKESYIEFGSLFSNSRLALHQPEFIWAKEYLHREIGTDHPLVNKHSQQVIDRLGGQNQFISVHIRQGDGFFKKIAADTMRGIEAILMKTIMMIHNDHTHNDTLAFKSALYNEKDRLQGCLALRDKHIPELSVIFMATDAENPRHQMKSLFDRYPCTFTLLDFPDIANNGMDLFFPMMDAEIASRASIFIGTPRSTYSSYVKYR
ncbi:hypothetical protein K501DRAFT_158396, partial [Backusella circina FSU 941]